MPEWYFIFIVAAFGLIIGSFLNVVIYRFHTGRSLNDRSHCLSCGKTLRWYELVPVFSYLALLGRCRFCQSFIPYRYVLVELLTAGAFILAYLSTSDIVSLVLLAILLSVLVVGLVYDLYHMIIPDEVSYGALVLAATLVGWKAFSLGSLEIIISALLGAGLAFLVFASLWYFSRGRGFGFGDAKLSLSLGILVGFNDVFSLIVFSFWIGALVSLAIIGWQWFIRRLSGHKLQGGVSIKSEVPFAPFLIAAFVLVYFFNVDVLTFIETFYVSF